MYLALQFIIFICVVLNLFLFDIGIGDISLTILMVAISWLFYIVKRIKVNVRISKDFVYLLLFYFSFFIITVLHPISSNNILFISSTILIALYIAPVYAPLIKYEKQVKYLFLFLFCIYIAHYLFSNQIGVREYKGFVFENINGFSYTILHFSIIVIILSKPKTQLLTLIVALIIIAFTLSRGPLVLLVTGLLVFILHKPKFKIYIIFFISTLFTTSVIYSLGIFDDFILRTKSIFDSNLESSSTYRLSVFFDGFKHLFDFPFGTGFESFSNYFWMYSDINYSPDHILPIDNSFILLIYSSGIIPILFLAGLFYRLYSKKNLYLSIILSVFIGHMLFDDVILSPRYLLLFSICIIYSKAFHSDPISLKSGCFGQAQPA